MVAEGYTLAVVPPLRCYKGFLKVLYDKQKQALKHTLRDIVLEPNRK